MCIYTTHAGMEMRNEDRRGMSGKSSAVPTLVPVLAVASHSSSAAPRGLWGAQAAQLPVSESQTNLLSPHHFWIRCIGDS